MSGDWKSRSVSLEQPQSDSGWKSRSIPIDDTLTPSNQEQVSGTQTTPMGVLRAVKDLVVPTPEQAPEAIAQLGASFIKRTPVGLVAAPLLTAGANLGTQAYQYATDSPNAPQSWGEVGKRAGAAAVRGLAGEAMGRTAGWAMAPGASGYTAEKIAQESAAKDILGQDVSIPLVNRTESKVIQGAAQASEYTPTGSMVSKQKTNVLDRLNRFVDDFGKKISTKTDSTISGADVKAGIINSLDLEKEATGRVYEDVLKNVGDIPTDNSAIISKIDQILSSRGGPAEPSGLGMLGEIRASLSSKPSLDPILPTPGQPDVSTISGLRTLKSNLGQRIKSAFGDPSISGLKSDLVGLYGTVAETIKNTIGKVDPESGKILASADSSWKKAMDFADSALSKSIGRVKDENVFKVVIGDKSQMELARKWLPEPEFMGLARNWFEGLVKKGSEETYSPARMLSNLQKNQATAEVVFRNSPELMGLYNKLVKTTELLSSSKQATQGSQTAFWVGTLAMANKLASDIALAMGNLAQGDVMGAAGHSLGVAGVGALSQGGRFIASDFGGNYLTRGFPRLVQPAKSIAGTSTDIALQKAGEALFPNKKIKRPDKQ